LGLSERYRADLSIGVNVIVKY